MDALVDMLDGVVARGGRRCLSAARRTAGRASRSATSCDQVNERVDDPDERWLRALRRPRAPRPGRPADPRWGESRTVRRFTKRRSEPGQVLFGKRRAYQRKVAVADFDGVCSATSIVLRAEGPKSLCPSSCRSSARPTRFFEHAIGDLGGLALAAINWKTWREYEFALPPLDEQRRIADVLLRVEATRERSATSTAAWTASSVSSIADFDRGQTLTRLDAPLDERRLTVGACVDGPASARIRRRGPRRPGSQI